MVYVILMAILFLADIRYISHSYGNAKHIVQLETRSVWVGWKCTCGEGWDRRHVEGCDLEDILTLETEELMKQDKVLHPSDTT